MQSLQGFGGREAVAGKQTNRQDLCPGIGGKKRKRDGADVLKDQGWNLRVMRGECGCDRCSEACPLMTTERAGSCRVPVR